MHVSRVGRVSDPDNFVSDHRLAELEAAAS